MEPQPTVLGLDIGGANLKAVHTGGQVRSVPYAVWRRPGGLAAALAELIAGFPSTDLIAATMTAELCDCFPAKSAGVVAVLDALEQAVSAAAAGSPIRIWLTDGRLVGPEAARRQPLLAAAANWLALATWAGRLCPSGPALVADVGSTTTDLIPLRDGVPVPAGRTDLQRLASGELVYCGVRRTPVCALVEKVELAGSGPVRVAAELFATTLDVYLLLGDLDEDGTDTDTADGRPATRDCAAARLARMLCADRSALGADRLMAVARQVAEGQIRRLRQALAQVVGRLGQRPHTVLVCGAGEFLAARLFDWADYRPQRLVRLSERLSPSVSAAACAHALAVLARERFAP